MNRYPWRKGKLRFLTLVPAALLLAACGGSGQPELVLVDIGPVSTAVIAIDVWKVDGVDEPYSSISANVIGPLLEACRDENIVIIHALHRPIGWDGVNPDYNGDYDIVQGVADGVVLVDRPGEYIERFPVRVQSILEFHNIRHVVWVGFAADACILNRKVGVINMTAEYPEYSYHLIEDATWGSSESATLAALDEIEEMGVELLTAASFFDRLATWQAAVGAGHKTFPFL